MKHTAKSITSFSHKVEQISITHEYSAVADINSPIQKVTFLELTSNTFIYSGPNSQDNLEFITSFAALGDIGFYSFHQTKSRVLNFV